MANCCCLKYLNVVTVITSRMPSLLAEVSHDEAFLPRRERPLLAGNRMPKMCAIPQLVSAPLKSIKNIEALSVKGFN